MEETQTTVSQVEASVWCDGSGLEEEGNGVKEGEGPHAYTHQKPVFTSHGAMHLASMDRCCFIFLFYFIIKI